MDCSHQRYDLGRVTSGVTLGELLSLPELHFLICDVGETPTARGEGHRRRSCAGARTGRHAGRCPSRLASPGPALGMSWAGLLLPHPSRCHRPRPTSPGPVTLARAMASQPSPHPRSLGWSEVGVPPLTPCPPPTDRGTIHKVVESGDLEHSFVFNIIEIQPFRRAATIQAMSLDADRVSLPTRPCPARPPVTAG